VAGWVYRSQEVDIVRRKIKEIEERKTAEGLELKRQIEKLEQQHEA
jgi:hypothetical protein